MDRDVEERVSISDNFKRFGEISTNINLLKKSLEKGYHENNPALHRGFYNSIGSAIESLGRKTRGLSHYTNQLVPFLNKRLDSLSLYLTECSVE